MYDLIFYLYSSYNTAHSFEYYINKPKVFKTSYDNPYFELMIVFCIKGEEFGFRIGGIDKGFIKDWWNNRTSRKYIIQQQGGFRPSETMEMELIIQLEKY